MPLLLFSKKPYLYLTSLSLISNPLSKFYNCNLKCFPPACKITVYLYLMKYVYSKLLYSMLLLLSWLAKFCFNTSSFHFPESVNMDPKYSIY